MKLKRCPFCGGEPRFVNYGFDNGESADWSIECLGCGVVVMAPGKEPGALCDKEDCAGVWNRRTGTGTGTGTGKGEDAGAKALEVIDAACFDFEDGALTAHDVYRDFRKETLGDIARTVAEALNCLHTVKMVLERGQDGRERG